jgi:hypothetical protein
MGDELKAFGDESRWPRRGAAATDLSRLDISMMKIIIFP